MIVLSSFHRSLQRLSVHLVRAFPLVVLSAAATVFAQTLAEPAKTMVLALPQRIAADNPQLQFIGRFDRAETVGPRCAWSASTIRLRFEGASLNVLLKSTGADFWEVFVDGRAASTLEIVQGTEIYPVIRDLPPGPHMVELVKRTEFNIGVTQFFGFQSDAQGRVLPMALSSARRIEVIGDSISCGYGDEAPTKEEKFTPRRENAAIAYGALTARELGADYLCIAWSGKKLWPNNSILDHYDLVLPKEHKAAAWEFTAWTPDVVVINLGTNDFGVSDPDGAGWTEAYRALIQRLRRQYPHAWIYPTLGTMLGDWPAPRKPASTIRGYLTTLTREFNAAGDTRVRFIDFGTQKKENGYGGGYHPSAKTHAVMADQLTKVLRADLDW